MCGYYNDGWIQGRRGGMTAEDMGRNAAESLTLVIRAGLIGPATKTLSSRASGMICFRAPGHTIQN